jgi:hypothetical protein
LSSFSPLRQPQPKKIWTKSASQPFHLPPIGRPQQPSAAALSRSAPDSGFEMREKQSRSPPCWLLSKLFRRRDARLCSPPDLTAPAPPRSAADLSPYSPLPAICSRRESAASAERLQDEPPPQPPPEKEEPPPEADEPPPQPPLLRQKTYVVEEPVVVMGPAKKLRRRKLDRSKAWHSLRQKQQSEDRGFFVVGADDCENGAPDENERKENNADFLWFQY